jgi:hypothetical protein
MTVLRDYQAHACNMVRAAYKILAEESARTFKQAITEGRTIEIPPPACLLVCPTGGGKTAMGASFALRAVEKGWIVLWLAHRVELVKQAFCRLVRSGIDAYSIGVVMAGLPAARAVALAFDPLKMTDDQLWEHYAARNAEARIQVGSIQTIDASGEVPDAQVVIFDEAHHVAAESWLGITRALKCAKAILGLTATPERTDGAPLDPPFKKLVVACSVQSLIDSRWLVPIEIIGPGRYQKELSEDPAEAYIKHAAGRRAVVFTSTVKHSDQVAADLNARGVPAASIHGGTKAAKRAEVLRDFREGKIMAVCNPMILTEGWDEPRCKVAIIARGCSAPGLWIQMIGRIARPENGIAAPGEIGLVLDLRGCVWIHGLFEEERIFSLTGVAIRRKDGAALRCCKNCGKIELYRASCSRCGFFSPPPPPPKVKRAPLSKIDAAQLQAQWAEKRRAFFAMRGKMLRDGGQRKEVNDQFSARFGHRPPASWWNGETHKPAQAGTEEACSDVGSILDSEL